MITQKPENVKKKTHNATAIRGLMEDFAMYFYASWAWLICAAAWFVIWVAEAYSPNGPRLRSFRVDQRDLWDHLTKKKD